MYLPDFTVVDLEARITTDVEWFDIKVDVVLPWNLSDIFLQNMELADKLEQPLKWQAFLSHIWHSKNVSFCSSFIFHPLIKQCFVS